MVEKPRQTNLTRKRYNRLAFLYDFLEAPLEWLRFGKWRCRLGDEIAGPSVLEVGVRTGKNLTYYPPDVSITGIDLSPRMLEKAKTKAAVLNLDSDLKEMDVQQLTFPDHSFDTVFATFVFCSVPNPSLGFMELRRVCKRDGKSLLLEHMRPGNFLLGMLFDVFNPLVVRMMGANINRRTMRNIRKAGWRVQVEEHLSLDIVRWIEAIP
jgi:ubiquinone/menaquinone biosynthesis C-methylase UbiE